MTSEAPLDLRLLGAMEACVRGTAGDRRLGKGKPVALLAFLSLAPGRRASRERLATLLWSEGSSDAARQNLRQTLWYLKRRLGEVMQADDDSVALLPGATSDVDRFTAAASAERYEEAVGAYLGDFVPEFAAPGAAGFEEWADLERRRLRATFVGCAEALARGQLTGGRAADAVRLAKRVREIAPDDPSAWRLLLEALVAARDALGAAAAVAQLEAEIARDEMEPDPAVRSLLRAARKLASGSEAEGGSADAVESSLVPDLIGREPEFRTLVDAWEGARRGRGRALLISGAAGLGKTRLITDFAARVLSTRGRTVQVRAHPGNRTISGSLAALIAEGLAALPGSAAISPGSASVLVALSPLLASSFRGAEPDRSTGDDATRRRVAALGELIGLLTETTPLALLVDDAHWADAESMRIVGALRGKVEESRAVLVIASRLPDDLRSQMGGVEEVALRPLDVAGVAEFVGRIAAVPTEPWSRHFVTRLHEVTHGIPLLLIETLQRLVEDGVLARVEGQWHAASAEAVAQALPNESALIARLKSLSPAERTALVRLATIGRPVSPATLPPAPEHGAWDGVLTELERRSFVARTERTVSVWHDEVARGVLELATPDERLAAHAWVSDALAERATTMAEYSLAALHASRAADEGRLRRVWLAALGFAREGGDVRPAAVLAREVLGTEASGDRVKAMVRSTPWGMRVGLRWGRAAAAIVVLIGLAGWVQWPAPAPADAVDLYFEWVEDPTQVLHARVAPGGAWNADEPVVAKLVSIRKSPARFDSNIRGLFQIPGRQEWAGIWTYPDSGGDEWVRVRTDQAIERLSNAPGDHGYFIPLPDGRGFVANTRAFDREEHQADIVILDSASQLVRRLTEGPQDEGNAIPSPDGTRLLYRRFWVTERKPAEVCVSGLDGADEICAWEDLPIEDPLPVGWMDARSVLVQDKASLELYRLDVVGGRGSRIGSTACRLLPLRLPDLLTAVCTDPRTKEDSFGIARTFDPLRVRPMRIEGRPIGNMARSWVAVSSTFPRRYLDRLRLQVADTMLQLGSTGGLRVSGIDAEGSSIEVFGVRYSSTDSTILTVDRDGTMHPHRTGRAWARVTAGGWRTDSIAITVGRSESRTVVRESWSERLDGRWLPFGDPTPSLAREDSGFVLLPNGDGIYSSGVISRFELRGTRGVGIEVFARLPVDRLKLQNLGLGLIASPSDSVLAAWLGQTPSGRFSGNPLCGTALPAGEGLTARYLLQASGTSPEPATVPLADPDRFYGTQWHRIRLQYFPDGRCGLAIDGVAIARTRAMSAPPGRMRVVIGGSSVRTRIAVGGVEVWEGVRGDIVWR